MKKIGLLNLNQDPHLPPSHRILNIILFLILINKLLPSNQKPRLATSKPKFAFSRQKLLASKLKIQKQKTNLPFSRIINPVPLTLQILIQIFQKFLIQRFLKISFYKLFCKLHFKNGIQFLNLQLMTSLLTQQLSLIVELIKTVLEESFLLSIVNVQENT